MSKAPPYSWKTTGRGEAPIIPEPINNVYGRFKVLMRVDGLFAVHDTKQWPPNGPTYQTERLARAAAEVMAKRAQP